MTFHALLSRRTMLAMLLSFVAGTPPAQALAPMDERQALHLLNRLGYGPVPGQVERVRAMGVHAYVESQLSPPPLAPGLEAALADRDMPVAEQRLLRAIASPRQLEEVLAAFWANHVKEDDADARQALVRHFVSAPSGGLQQAVARVWESSGGDQRAVLRMLLTSREFLAPQQWGSKRKDGFHFVVSAVRASGVVVENVAPLMQYVRSELTKDERADFIERLTGGRLALGMAPVRPHEYASSAPPQGSVLQPGPVLMAAPTPSAAAMAAAARSQPIAPGRLRDLLRSEEFLRY